MIVLLLIGLVALGMHHLSVMNGAERTAADQSARIEKLESELEAKSGEATKANAELKTAEACIDEVRDYFATLDGQLDLEKITKAILAVQKRCRDYEIT